MSILQYLFSPAWSDLKERDQATLLLAKRMSASNRKRKSEAQGLQETIARLMLIVETQHRMLLKKGVCTQAEFDALLNEIDLEDGVADGRRTPR
jgi:hypothetical protein